MARGEDLTAVVQHEVAAYACPSPNSTAYYLEDPTNQVYAVVVVPQNHTHKVAVMIMARVVNDITIIEADITNKPMVDALVQAGIPREQIVLAYAGESPPAA